MSSFDYLNGYDPGFWQEGEWQKCDKCGTEFDRNEYNSDTCVECEDEEVRLQTIQEREKENEHHNKNTR